MAGVGLKLDFANWNTEIVASTSSFNKREESVPKMFSFLTWFSMILVNIKCITLSSKLGQFIMLKWRRNLGVTGFLPPDGGHMAPTNTISVNFLSGFSFSEVSNQAL